MLVRYWMTESLYVATEGMTLLDTLRVMKEKQIRRLPVVHGKELRGIISRSDLYQFIDPLVIEESKIPANVAAELDTILVGQHMTSWPYTCEPNDPVEEVGARMRQKKVGCMPVVAGDELVGLITESDIFDALTQLTGWGLGGDRICLRITNDQKADVFFRVVELCKKFDLELLTLLTHPFKNQNAQMVLVRVLGAREKEFVGALWDEYQVLVA
ncbi:MAG: CBS domain-containing protein [Planctomycetota bacterium]